MKFILAHRSRGARGNAHLASNCFLLLRSTLDDHMATDGMSDQAMVTQQIAVAPVTRFSGRHQQPLPIRITHWCNVVFIVLMAGSGLQILAAKRVDQAVG